MLVQVQPRSLKIGLLMDQSEIILMKETFAIINEENQNLYERYDEDGKKMALDLLNWANTSITIANEQSCPLARLVILARVGEVINKKMVGIPPGTGHL